jgi:hypothetical protein
MPQNTVLHQVLLDSEQKFLHRPAMAPGRQNHTKCYKNYNFFEVKLEVKFKN